MNKTLKTFIQAAIALTFIASFIHAGEQKLFNDTDLTGWDGAPGWWYVENGALTSESTPRSLAKNPTT